MKRVIITLNPGLGAGLGLNFTVTIDVAGYSWDATLPELLAGFEIIAPDAATYVYITSLGVCLNVLSLPINPFTTTTTSTTSTSSSTTTTTTTEPCVINPTVDDVEWFTTTTTTTTTTIISELCSASLNYDVSSGLQSTLYDFNINPFSEKYQESKSGLKRPRVLGRN